MLYNPRLAVIWFLVMIQWIQVSVRLE